MSRFTIVPAGAGAGKTHRIGAELVDLVRQKKVDPARILAVTFTEAAASELRQRIRGLLLKEGMVRESIAVERAYISTIHSLGLRILTEHAFANGSSPVPRLLTDDERDILIRRILVQAPDLAEISADISRYGFSGNGYDGRSSEDVYREAVARSVSLLSTLRDPESGEDLSSFSVQEIIRIYGPVAPDPKVLADGLHTAITDLLSAFPEGVPTAGMNDTARRTFGDNLRDLRKGSRREQLDWDWSLWNKLRKLRRSVKGTPTPPGYDDLADAVIAAANGILSHPGPRDDACALARSLIRGAASILGSYSEQKASLGVIDFGDMVRDAERLLRQSSSVRKAVLDEIDCVIVDEFQDTNPIQFALLWQLASAAPHALFVGDIKQAIMEFQGADPRLTAALITQFGKNVAPLTSNWRSDPRIMAFINALGPQLFPGEYHDLQPKRPAGSAPALTALSVEGSRAARGGAWRPEQHVASYIGELLRDSPPFIRNRDKGTPRRPVAGDVAILCRTHSQCAAYASALRNIGLPARVNGGDWWNSPVVLATRYALSLAADPEDRHAALAYATLGPPGLPLEAALRELISGTLLDRPEIVQVQSIHSLAGSATVSTLLSEVIEQSGMRDWIEAQPDPFQARADLLRIESEALEFQALHRDVKAASGFHGSGPQVFLGWLKSKVSDERLNSRPDPSGDTSDGIEVVTWHASKGREWPVVIVATMDGDYSLLPGTIQTEFTSFADLDKVLETARLRYTPSFSTPEAWKRFEDTLLPAAERTARRLLYVALTRARDSLVLEWPAFKFSKKTKEGAEPPISYAHLLAGKCSLDLRPDAIALGELAFPAQVVSCPKSGWTGVPVSPSGEPPQTSMAGRPAILRQSMRDAGPAWSIQPSSVAPIASAAPPPKFEIVKICEPLEVGSAIDGSAAQQGTLLHDAFRAILLRPDLAVAIGERCGLDHRTSSHLVTQASAFRNFLSSRGWKQLSLELPISGAMPDGSTISGVIDCLGYGDSSMVIIDHKTNKGDDLAAASSVYRLQLELYGSAIHASGYACSTIYTGIHWLRHGIITLNR